MEYLKRLQSQTDALWKQFAENQVQLDKNQQQLDENKLQMDANKKELNAQQQELAYLKKNSVQLKNDYDVLSNEVGYNTAQIGQLRAELRTRIQDQLHDLCLQTIKSAKSSKIAQQMVISFCDTVIIIYLLFLSVDQYPQCYLCDSLHLLRDRSQNRADRFECQSTGDNVN
ncbi:hypothetical protein MP228_003694 [Amoeboaphelidium protococcarum]|nr:hypothetical protein MP228_003694 [Amoeboaphelidium protococcarum]